MHIHWIYWIQIRLHKIFTGYSQVVHERIQGMVQMISLTSPAVLGASLSSSEPVWMDGDVPWSKQLTPLPTHNVYIHVFLTHIQVTGRFLSFFELLPKCCRMYYIHRLVLYTSYFPGVQLLLYYLFGPSLSLCMYVYIYMCACVYSTYNYIHLIHLHINIKRLIQSTITKDGSRPCGCQNPGISSRIPAGCWSNFANRSQMFRWKAPNSAGRYNV